MPYLVAPALPSPRGLLTEALFDLLGRPCGSVDAGGLPAPDGHPLGEDTQLALYCLYELHYRGFAGVDERWEWDPALLARRAALEQAFEDAVGAEIGVPPPAGDVGAALRLLVDDDPGPSLSRAVLEDPAEDRLAEICIHRSAYQLKEADPHTWAVPRLRGRAKSALLEIQVDEYGGGRPGAAHAELFASTMAALGLDPTYGAYLDALPAATLATVNLVSMFGLHRRRRGALIGHLAYFEMTSVVPMSRYGAAFAAAGLDAPARRFFDAHVVADAAHEILAVEMARALVADEPALAGDVVFGAAAVRALERRFASMVLAAWTRGESSLRWAPGAPRLVAAERSGGAS